MDRRYKHLDGEERDVILAEHRRGASLREIGGRTGAWLTVAICGVTLACQVRDQGFFDGSVWVTGGMVFGAAYYALIARHRLELTPEETAVLAAKRN